MRKEDAEILAEKGFFEDKKLDGKLVETHISWVILSGEFAFKIKKPLKLSFLDFSTLALRKKFCYRELELNSRFSNIYCGVFPIEKKGDKWRIGENGGETVDFAVQMKLMDNELRMDELLSEDKVQNDQIVSLAKQVARFHQEAPVISDRFELKEAKALFNDMGNACAAVKNLMGTHRVDTVKEAIAWSDSFLSAHQTEFQRRVEQGFVRDVHGDLHSGNVFLTDPPVVFDCIEFNDKIRQIDVLYEVAFMCMDLEAFGKKDLSDLFLTTYQSATPDYYTSKDAMIFLYFKCLRANVRAKVTMLALEQAEDSKDKEELMSRIDKYLELMVNYRNSG
jgi:aminoglycoside phosphotransferase family enzyme